jgi:sec-independent protein translocase protein TatA
MNLGVTELLIILGVVLLLFGSTRLPKLAKSLGQASKEFKQGVSESREDADDDLKRTEPAAIEAKDTKKPV